MRFILIYCSIVIHMIAAQDTQYRFVNYGINEGLSQLAINSMLQDQDGFIWIGTQDGLNRFDGINFKIYKNIKNDSTSISENNVLKIIEDKHGNMWVGTRLGLNKYNREKDNFTRIEAKNFKNQVIQDILAISKEKIWFATENGLFLYNVKKDRFRQFTHNKANPRSLSNNLVRSLYLDSKKRFWVGTDNGLNFFNPIDSSFINYYHKAEVKNTLSNSAIFHINESHEGLLWISTPKGLNLFNPVTQTVKRYFDSDNQGVSNSDIRFSFENDERNIVFGSHGGGLYFLNRRDNSLVNYQNEFQNDKSLVGNGVISYMKDNANDLWIGTLNGLSKVDQNLSNFRHITANPFDKIRLKRPEVYSIFNDEDNLYVGSLQGGLNIYNRKSNKIHYLSTESEPALSSNTVLSIGKNYKGEILIGTFYGGLNILNPRNNKIKILSDNSSTNPLGSNIVNHFFEDEEGLWISLFNYGVDYLDYNTNKVRHFTPTKDDPNSLSSTRIRFIKKDKLGRLLIGTDGGGLNVLHTELNTFKHYTIDSELALSSNSLMDVFVLEDNRFILGTSNGLNILDLDKNTNLILTEEDGLPNDVIYGILQDKENYFWLSTNKGLSRFNFETKEFKNYNQKDGLNSSEFNSGAFFKDKDGILYFGTSKGIVYFDPLKFKDNNYIPPVKITEVQILNKEEKIINNSISLNNDQNVISFRFVALNYIHPEKNQYAYQMLGFDKEWIYSGTRNFVTYTNLDPGSYIFKVKASNNDGLWNEEGVQVNLTITPPFYDSPLFQFAIILIFILGILLWYLNIRKQKIRLEKIVDSRTEKLRKTTGELEKINEFIQALNMDIEFDDLVETVLKESFIIEGVECATLIALDKDSKLYDVRQTIGQDLESLKHIKMTEEETLQRYTQNTSEIDKDIYLINEVEGRVHEDKLEKVPHSMVAMKIIIDDILEGFFVLENMTSKNAFAKSDVQLLKNLKVHIVAAYHKAKIVKELQVLNEKKNIFLGFAAHDLRNPLTNIIGYVSLLMEYIKQDIFDKDKILKDLNHILKMSDNMSLILTDLLDISAIESGKVNLTLKRLKLRAILEENLEYYKRVANQKDISLEINMSNIQILPDILVDKSKITEVLDNLLSNALKYTYPGGRVVVDGKVDGSHVIIEVTDTGQGLSKEDLKEMFTSFKRLSAKPTAGETSTGLGLMIVKKLVEMHGGSIWVESKKGEGSTFTFSVKSAS